MKTYCFKTYHSKKNRYLHNQITLAGEIYNLSRGKWDVNALALKLLQLIQKHFENWVYIYDETHTIKTGKAQFGLHFFRNYRYQKRNTNQSKFHWGHQLLG